MTPQEVSTQPVYQCKVRQALTACRVGSEVYLQALALQLVQGPERQPLGHAVRPQAQAAGEEGQPWHNIALDIPAPTT